MSRQVCCTLSADRWACARGEAGGLEFTVEVDDIAEHRAKPELSSRLRRAAERRRRSHDRRGTPLILRAVGADHQVIGKVGRLTGAIAAGRMGEVMIPIRGGTEAYFAYAFDPEEAIPRGTRVVVIEHDPPRTVIVSRIA